MNQNVLADLLSTPYEDWPGLPDDVLVTAARMAVEETQIIAALTIGVEIGRREQQRGLDGELLQRVADATL